MINLNTLIVVTLVAVTSLRAQPRPPIAVTFSIKEEVAENSFIGNLTAAAGLGDVYSPEVLSRLRFSYLSQPALTYNFEMISGILFTAGRIDREAICESEVTCADRFDVAIKPVEYLQFIKVTIVIEDINDNFPTFAQASVSHQMLESAALGTTLLLPSAVDHDSPRYAIQNYTWDDPSNRFFLDTIPKMDGSMDLRLRLQRPLDREFQDEYRVTVTAFDGSGYSGTCEVFITVMDANDNNPMFLSRQYDVTIEENLPIGRSILNVHAMDDDLGENGEVVYNFSTRTNNKLGHLFEIDEYTGDIRIKGPIDFEVQEVYHLGLIARDRGVGSLPADAMAIVQVTDVNDNAPEIKINTLTEAAEDGHIRHVTTSEVLEHSDIGTFVAHVTVTDKDTGANGEIECYLSSESFLLDPIYGNEFAIVTNRELNREATARFELMIECADNGEPKLWTEKRLRVDVTDKNDHAPIFQRHRYTEEVDENNRYNLQILQVILCCYL